MPPKESSVRRAEAGRAGKDAETVEETKQTKLDGHVDVEEAGTGSKRERPVDLTGEDDEQKDSSSSKKSSKKDDKDQTDNVTQQDVQDSGKKDGQPASKRQKAEAADKAGLEGGAEAIDAVSEEAKAKGREIKEDSDVQTVRPSRGTLEKGQIYFVYKPKVEVDDPEGIDDVSKCHALLVPHHAEDSGKSKYRLLNFGRKHAPASRDDGNHEVEWGMITKVGEDVSELKDALGPSTYETKTRGTRHQPASRVAAAGYYILHSPTEGEGVKPLEDVTDKEHPRDFPVYLAYSIAVPTPEEFGDVQTELCIKPTGSFSVQVKNPDTASSNPRAASSSNRERDEYPPELRGLFTTRFIAANPIQLLDYAGQELLFISGRDHLPDSAEQDGVVKPAQAESKEFEEAGGDAGGKKADEAVFKEVYEELHLYKSAKDVPGIKALEGEWA